MSDSEAQSSGGGGHRQKGNEFFQTNNYDEALVAYSKAIVSPIAAAALSSSHSTANDLISDNTSCWDIMISEK